MKPGTTRRHVRHNFDNVRTHFEGVGHVTTGGIDDDGGPWWVHKTSGTTPVDPPRSLDSTSRNDYRPLAGERPKARSVQPARGIVPISGLDLDRVEPTLLKEKISFEHACDLRSPGDIKTRQKNQGSFILTEISSINKETSWNSCSELKEACNNSSNNMCV